MFWPMALLLFLVPFDLSFLTLSVDWVTFTDLCRVIINPGRGFLLNLERNILAQNMPTIDRAMFSDMVTGYQTNKSYARAPPAPLFVCSFSTCIANIFSDNIENTLFLKAYIRGLQAVVTFILLGYELTTKYSVFVSAKRRQVVNHPFHKCWSHLCMVCASHFLCLAIAWCSLRPRFNERRQSGMFGCVPQH